MQFLNKLERRFGRYAIPNLMTILTFGMALVFLLDTFTAANPNYEYSLSSILYFDRELILQGQIWRILTFLFLPPDSSLFFIIFALYFYWMIGTSLENQWGSFKFNVYYFTGMIGTIISGIITGYATNTYLNLSLFLAFAAIFPDYEILLLFFIPIKMKFLAILDGLLLLFSFIMTNSLSYRISILVSVLNFLLFFGKRLGQSIYHFFRRKNHQNQSEWKNNHWWNDDDNNPWKK